MPEGTLFVVDGKTYQIKNGKPKKLVASRATKIKAAATYLPRKTWAGAKRLGRGIVWLDERTITKRTVHAANTVGALSGAYFYTHNMLNSVKK